VTTDSSPRANPLDASHKFGELLAMQPGQIPYTDKQRFSFTKYIVQISLLFSEISQETNAVVSSSRQCFSHHLIALNMPFWIKIKVNEEAESILLTRWIEGGVHLSNVSQAYSRCSQDVDSDCCRMFFSPNWLVMFSHVLRRAVAHKCSFRNPDKFSMRKCRENSKGWSNINLSTLFETARNT